MRVFQKIHGLAPRREAGFSVDLILVTSPISRAPNVTTRNARIEETNSRIGKSRFHLT